MELREKLAVGFGVLILISLSLSVGLLFSFVSAFDSQPGHFSHQISYDASFKANGSLNDTVFILPYPEDERFRAALNGTDPNATIINDFNASTSLTDSGFLRLDLGDFRPQTRRERFSSEVNITPERDEEIRKANLSGINKYSSYDFIVKIDYNRSIDTRRGLSEEPHLVSNSSDCDSPRESGCAVTEAFVSYEAKNDTFLELDFGIEGTNSWTEGFSWQGNSYRQDFYNSYYENDYLTGSQDRWIQLFGREVEGDGVYREE